jgi:N utilization substance protein B
VQLLYLWEVRGRPPLAGVISQAQELLPPMADRAVHLLESASTRVTALDARIAELAERWRLERIGVVERAILRVALAELEEGETPPRVVLDEAVRLARWFGGAKAPAFVNGVLDGAARSLGRL